MLVPLYILWPALVAVVYRTKCLKHFQYFQEGCPSQECAEIEATDENGVVRAMNVQLANLSIELLKKKNCGKTIY